MGKLRLCHVFVKDLGLFLDKKDISPWDWYVLRVFLCIALSISSLLWGAYCFHPTRVMNLNLSSSRFSHTAPLTRTSGIYLSA